MENKDYSTETLVQTMKNYADNISTLKELNDKIETLKQEQERLRIALLQYLGSKDSCEESVQVKEEPEINEDFIGPARPEINEDFIGPARPEMEPANPFELDEESALLIDNAIQTPENEENNMFV